MGGDDRINGYDLANEEIITTAEADPDDEEGDESDGEG
jgi:hypothetical protein